MDPLHQVETAEAQKHKCLCQFDVQGCSEVGVSVLGSHQSGLHKEDEVHHLHLAGLLEV